MRLDELNIKPHNLKEREAKLNKDNKEKSKEA